MTEGSEKPAPDGSWLVFGASGAVGHFLLPQLTARGVATIAVTRQDPVPAPSANLAWIRADLERAGTLASPAVIVSLGPLDRFATWLGRSWPASTRHVVALSSTSVATKAESSDPGERAVADRLRLAERSIAAQCEVHDATWTILRPTLVYGGGGDRNLSRLAELARRFGTLPLPAWATGLRQPVHAQDVALAALACAGAPPGISRAYDLPGGETLSYREMVERVLVCLPGRPRLLIVPEPFASPLFALAAGGLGVRAALARTRENLVFEAQDASRDFGYRPRAFQPEAAMFTRLASRDRAPDT